MSGAASRPEASGAADSGVSPLARHLVGLALYHAALLFVSWLLVTRWPELFDLFNPKHFRAPHAATGLLTDGSPPAAPAVFDAERVRSLASATALAILGALAIAVPVAWVYALTRRRKGWTQAVAQTLLLLPVVVAGVVTLVQDSLALAFSLAGIVAAVRFRNTLEDTKDAVYIFAVTGIGIAAGVGELAIGLVTSLLFNAVVLVLWWTEFGRAPADLEGSPAYRRLARARALAEGGGEFVAALDKELLAALSPAQLESLAARAWRRRQLDDEAPLRDRRFPFNALLRLTAGSAADLDTVKLAAESVLVAEAKRFELSALQPGDGGVLTLEYLVRLGKRADRGGLLEALRVRSGPALVGVELR